MASTVDHIRSRVTTWDAVKKRRVSNDNALKELPINVPERPPKPLVEHEDSRPRLEASRIYNAESNAIDGPGIYTQRHLAASTPGPTQNPLLDLSHPYYGLPERLVQNLRAMGIRSIYPWQSSCLLGRGNLSGERNLVYTAPTGGGKSLVADVLMLKRVLEGQKALLVLPYVALIQEKLKWLRRAVEGVVREPDETWQSTRPTLLDGRGVRIAGFYGGSKTRDHWIDVDIAVCTIEKVRNALDQEYR
jgi:DEAD/DEAH box helicase